MALIKTKLFLDFDNTIVDTTSAIVSCYNEDYRYYKKFIPINPCDVETYDFEELTLASKHYVDHLFNRPRFFERLQFMDNAEEALNILKDRYEIHIVSMAFRPNSIGKQLWISQHLPFIQKENIHIVNLKKYMDKSCVDMSNGIHIDDSTTMLKSSNAKIKYVFGDICSYNQDWNSGRLHNWYEVLAELVLPD